MVGCGGTYPVSSLGRVVAILPSLVGVALIVLSAGILTGGYMDEMRKEIGAKANCTVDGDG